MIKKDFNSNGVVAIDSESKAELFLLAKSGGQLFKKVCNEFFHVQQTESGRSILTIEAGEYEIRLNQKCSNNSWVCIDDSISSNKRPLEKICMTKENEPPITAWADAFIENDTVSLKYYNSNGEELDVSEFSISTCC